MVRIRLSRVGAKRQPSYRVVVADQRARALGRFIEIIGNYNPRTDPPTVLINEERALYWLKQGAQPSEGVIQMLKRQGIIAKYEASKADATPAADAA
jgi:small subunit ribosomal protein S16